ncbi:MAG: globin domain-containing protein [Prochloraceae cyanobacterium]|nr:globin domain-containing protein [Prochloraceae cyanobacterium]
MSYKFQQLDKKLDGIRGSIDRFASSFYDNLLKAHPEFQNLFKHSDMAEQKKMLAGILILVIRNWQRPQMLASTLKRLGARHVRYGALSEYYLLFGEVLLLTFKQYLGSDWDREMEQAWSEVYEAITTLMLEGYNEAKKANGYLIERKSAPSQQNQQSLIKLLYKNNYKRES